MTEEFVTLSIIRNLKKNNWKVLCFDFPQSGTGKTLKLNGATSEKNKDSIIPDIVAIKGRTVVFFENKDRFFLDDFKKVELLRTENCYSDSINKLLRKETFEVIYYGIGMPNEKTHIIMADKKKNMTDFILFVDGSGETKPHYNPQEIMFS